MTTDLPSEADVRVVLEALANDNYYAVGTYDVGWDIVPIRSPVPDHHVEQVHKAIRERNMENTNG